MSKQSETGSDLSFEDFLKVDIRAGTVIAAEPYPEARKPSYKITVDFGDEIGVKRTSAQVTVHYSCDELVGRRVMGVVNFPKKQIGKFMSEFLLLGFSDSDGAVLLAAVDERAPNGSRLH